MATMLVTVLLCHVIENGFDERETTPYFTAILC